MNIIITGASRGIGFELVKQFCRLKGNNIIAIARNTEALNKLPEAILAIKESVLYAIESDFEHFNFDTLLTENILRIFKKIDILINNAGTLINKPFRQLTDKNFDQIFNVNVKASFLIMKRLLPYFNNPSHIVNISSIGGLQGSEKFSGLSLYSASKGALAILTECLAVELKEKGIAVNCLALGGVQTKMFQEAFPGYKAETTAEDMAKYIMDFSLNGNKKYNGAIVPVNKTPL